MAMMMTRLKEVRTRAGLSQKALGDLIGCSQQVLSNYENGDRGIPVETLVWLVNYFNVSADYLLGITDNPEINR